MKESFDMLENVQISKRAITRLFVAAVVMVVAGAVIGTAVVIVALADGAIALGGPQLIAIDPGPVAGAVIGLVVASGLAGAGTVAAFAAWAGALLNTWRLEDKRWFTALAALGLVSFGWIALFAYVASGPDSTAPRPKRMTVAPAGD